MKDSENFKKNKDFFSSTLTQFKEQIQTDADNFRFPSFQGGAKEDKASFEKNSKAISKPYMKPG